MKILCIYFTNRIDKPNLNNLFAKIVAAIQDGYDEINLILSTNGGEVVESFFFYDDVTKANLKDKVNVYNACMIGSAGIVVYLAFTNRYCLANSYFMIHAAFSTASTANKPALLQYNNIMAKAIANNTSITEAQFNQMTQNNAKIYYNDTDAITNGISKLPAISLPTPTDIQVI